MFRIRILYRAVVAGLACVAVIGVAHTVSAAPRRVTTGQATSDVATGPKASKGNSARQFSGWITAFDASSLTVEKRGKQPRTLVFSKTASTPTSGDVSKEARVTVYYHDEGDQLIAQRVVVKPAAARGTAKTHTGTGSSARNGR